MTDTDNETLPPLSADTLPLYLPLWKDGALEADEAAEVESLVCDNPEAEAILGLLERSDQQLKSAFSDTLEAPIPIALARVASEVGTQLGSAGNSKPIARPGWGRVVSLAAAASVALLVAVPGSYIFGERQGRDTAQADAAAEIKARFGWIAQIVGYHRLYSAEERHLVEVAASEADHIRQWIGARTGREFAIPDLSAAGLEFRGARLLAVNGKPTAQLMYAPVDGGDPVGICFLKTGNPDGEFAQQTRDGLNMVTWRRDGYSFIALGTVTTDYLGEIAGIAAKVL